MGYQHIDIIKRKELAILLGKGYSLREIAPVLGVHPSSLSRELKRNVLQNGLYNPKKANLKAKRRRERSKHEGMKVSRKAWLRKYIQKKLEMWWTPEEISGRLQRDYGKSIVSFKTIYKWIYSPAGQAYTQFLPSKRHRPFQRKGNIGISEEIIKNRVSIDLRPLIIATRTRIGDFEGDALGKPQYCTETIVGIVDRSSRYFLAKKVRSIKKAMKIGYYSLLRWVRPLSVTFDNGVENASHEILGIPTYFCHPHSAWEKGTIENTFQRLRRFIPKKSNIAQYSDKYIDSVVELMNNTPRKCLNYQTPKEVFNQRVLHLGV